MTEPGWYEDPTDATHHRWWDGTTWTDATRPAPLPVPPPGWTPPVPPRHESPRRSRAVVLVVALVVAAVVGGVAIVVLTGDDDADVATSGTRPKATTTVVSRQRMDACKAELAAIRTAIAAAEVSNEETGGSENPGDFLNGTSSSYWTWEPDGSDWFRLVPVGSPPCTPEDLTTDTTAGGDGPPRLDCSQELQAIETAIAAARTANAQAGGSATPADYLEAEAFRFYWWGGDSEATWAPVPQVENPPC